MEARAPSVQAQRRRREVRLRHEAPTGLNACAQRPGLWMCEALVVSRSGFFASFKRPQCERARGDVVLGRIVRGSFGRSDRTYGARWVWHDVLAEGLSYGLHRVAHPIRASAFRVRPRRRRLLNDAGWRSIIAGNVLGRQFAAEGPNRRRGRGFHLRLDGGGLALCRHCSRSLSRRIIGWSIGASMTAKVVVNALTMALWRRGRPDEPEARRNKRRQTNIRAHRGDSHRELPKRKSESASKLSQKPIFHARSELNAGLDASVKAGSAGVPDPSVIFGAAPAQVNVDGGQAWR